MENYELPGFELCFRHLFETDFHLPANADPAAVARLENVIAELDDEKNLTTNRGYPYEELYKRCWRPHDLPRFGRAELPHPDA